MKKKASLVLILVIVLIQFIPTEKNISTLESNATFINAEATHSDQIAEISLILQTSCYDCHSNNTSYPWYNKIAPVSWYLAKHIKSGKEKLNFDEWSSYDAQEKEYMMHEITEVIEEQKMPLWSYTLVHQKAKLSIEEKNALLNFFKIP